MGDCVTETLRLMEAMKCAPWKGAAGVVEMIGRATWFYVPGEVLPTEHTNAAWPHISSCMARGHSVSWLAGNPRPNGGFGGFLVINEGDRATISAITHLKGEAFPSHLVGIEFATNKLTYDSTLNADDVLLTVDLIRDIVFNIASTRDQLVRRPAASTFGERRAFQRLGMKTPPPYYVVPVQQRVTVVELAVVKPEHAPVAIDWSHRWDVRGHERVHVKRGSLPMDATDERVLAMRGWRIYAHGAPMPADDAWRLSVRDHTTPAPGEWVALHSAWVRPHVKGPEDKPYVPALRVVVGEAK